MLAIEFRTYPILFIEAQNISGCWFSKRFNDSWLRGYRIATQIVLRVDNVRTFRAREDFLPRISHERIIQGAAGNLGREVALPAQ